MILAAYLAPLVAGGLVYFAARAWCSLMERLAGGYCTCLKGRVNRTCPIHGWEREDREPFPGANPW